jgi:hypothetical protein
VRWSLRRVVWSKYATQMGRQANEQVKQANLHTLEPLEHTQHTHQTHPTQCMLSIKSTINQYWSIDHPPCQVAAVVIVIYNCNVVEFSLDRYWGTDIARILPIQLHGQLCSRVEFSWLQALVFGFGVNLCWGLICVVNIYFSFLSISRVELILKSVIRGCEIWSLYIPDK